jgi:ubiquinone/menaquinone biosynthesis C-methylase UbiE
VYFGAARYNKKLVSSLTASLKNSAAGGVARGVYYRLYRASVRARCAWADYREIRDPGAPPLPPAMLRFRVSETIPAGEFVRVGHGVAGMVAGAIAEARGPLQPGDRVLDFGCGCARTLAWFMKAHPDVEFHGSDVDAEAIEWCSRNLPDGHFERNDYLPPLPYPDSHFDVVYCVSVFTHLNEGMQDQWLAELHRVLKPGGLLLFTVHGENALSTLSGVDLAELRSAGFLHRRSKKLSGVVPEWYHTSWHTRGYIAERCARWFGDIRYSSTPGNLQDLVTARRMLRS